MKIPSPKRPLQGVTILAALAFLCPGSVASPAPVPALSLRWLPAAGDSLVLAVDVALPPGWYINSHAPLDSFLVPTRLEASAPGLAFGAPRWPAPVVEHSDAMAGDMSLFKDPFEIRVTGRAPKGAKAKAAQGRPPARPSEVRATLHYQSCDGTMCWPPKTVTAVLRNGILSRE